MIFLPPDVAGDLVGISWIGPEGPREVVRVQTHNGVSIALVSRPGTNVADMVPVAELAKWQAIEERQAASALLQQKTSAAREAEEAEERRAAENTYGFLEQFTPMQRGRLLKALNRTVWAVGKSWTKKAWIEQQVRDGFRVTKDQRGDWFSADGVSGHRVKPWMTQTGMDYARYLSRLWGGPE